MKPEKGTKAQTRIPHRSRSVGAGRGGCGGETRVTWEDTICLPTASVSACPVQTGGKRGEKCSHSNIGLGGGKKCQKCSEPAAGLLTYTEDLAFAVGSSTCALA